MKASEEVEKEEDKAEEINKPVIEQDWSGMTYKWSDKVERVLQTVFKVNSFRPKQLCAINTTLSGHHVITVMPTGSGKNLSYQLPALVEPGITAIVSPSIAFMEDQVRVLAQKNIPALFISSTSSKEDLMKLGKELKNRRTELKLIYATAEMFTNNRKFMSDLQNCYLDGRLQRIAIVKVHCCSQLRYDFRTDYKLLGILAHMYPEAPKLGLTATPTADILNNVQNILNIPGCLVIKDKFNRPNLFYTVIEKPSSDNECLDLLEKLRRNQYKDESGIIYTHSLKDCEDLTDGLSKRGLRVKSYHATLEAENRYIVHKMWHDKSCQVIVTTDDFGWSIDRPDVRFVIHHSISRSLEDYYQESGRAGRDGCRAECVVLYRVQDIIKASTIISTISNLEHLYGMVQYCLNGSLCRRELIAKSFGEDWGNADCNKMCDMCLNENPNNEEIHLEAYCRTIANILDNAETHEVKLTAQETLDAWFCKGPVNLRQKGKEPNISCQLADDVIAYLLIKGFLVQDFDFTTSPVISYVKKAAKIEEALDEKFELVMPVRKYAELDYSCKPSSVKSDCDEFGESSKKLEKKRKSDFKFEGNQAKKTKASQVASKPRAK